MRWHCVDERNDVAQHHTWIEEFIAGSPHDAARDAMDHVRRPPTSAGRSENSHSRAPEQGTFIEHLESRQQIEVGIGVLMGLRGCSQTEAASDFTSAVHETGIAHNDLGRALAGLASGNDASSPHLEQARHRWGHLLALRGLDGDPTTPRWITRSGAVRPRKRLANC